MYSSNDYICFRNSYIKNTKDTNAIECKLCYTSWASIVYFLIVTVLYPLTAIISIYICKPKDIKVLKIRISELLFVIFILFFLMSLLSIK